MLPAPLAHALWLTLVWFALAWSAGAQAGGLPTFAVTLDNGKITPARLDVPARTRVKFTLHNTGTQPAEFENLNLHIEKILAPGVKSFVVVTIQPGEHLFVDEFKPDGPGMVVVGK